MPDNVAVPLPLAVKLTPPGSAPVLETVGTGTPVATTVNEPALPIVNVAVLADVIDGACVAGVIVTVVGADEADW